MSAPLEIDSYIHTTLLRDLVGHDRSPVAFLLYFWIAMEQRRRGGAVEASYAQLAEETGLSRSAAQAGIGRLLQRELIYVKRASVTATPVYYALTPWHRGRGTPLS